MEYWVNARKPVAGQILLLARVLSLLVFGLIVVAALSAPAEAANRRVYAGIVVDAKTGKTLYSHEADSIRYPASVTKVMTLYILFQELDAGHLSLNSKISISKHAAAAVPTKLGLPAGATISVEDAIGAIVTLSANDIARAIAENIEGSESAFAERMTRTAKALGMNHTHYNNASGLPDSGQVTTVRDQARLGIAIYEHFPKYYEYFQTRVFKYKGRSYGNHNRLLGDYGIDGIKTGYINAAGYNLLTAARKNGRHIVVAGFGFNTGGARNAKVASLVKTYLPKARSGSYLAQAEIAKPGLGGQIRVAALPVDPRPRPMFLYGDPGAPQPVTPRSEPIAVASIEPQQAAPEPPQPMPAPAFANGSKTLGLLPASALDATERMATNAPSAPAPQPMPANIVGAWMSKSVRLDSNTGSGPRPPAAIGGARTETIDLLTSGSVKEPGANDSWVVQIGATPDEIGARGLLDHAMDQVGDLADFRSFVETTTRDGQTLYRARFSGFGNRDQARRMCEQIKQKNMSCLAMQS